MVFTFTGFGQVIPGIIYPADGLTYFGKDVGVVGSFSTFIGWKSGQQSQGDYNAFFGGSSGINNNGSWNVFCGNQSGFNNKGSMNVFSGYQSGYFNQGSWNVFYGSQSGFSNTTGNYNVFNGFQSGVSNTTGTGNIFIGANSGHSNRTGSHNVFSGYQSGFTNSIGSYNVFSGYQSGYTNTTGSGNVFLGYSAGYSETGSNRLYIDNSNTTTPLIYGKFDTNQVGINTTNIPIGFAFAVKGKVITEEINIALQGSAIWPDYVFNDDYKLPSLKEVEKHIIENGHLQNIPSAAEVSESGIFLGAMNVKLLQKIEELTLYSIQQQKELEYLKAENENYKSFATRLSALEKELKK